MQRVNITLPDKLLKDLDNYCQENGFQRSELIRELLRGELYPTGVDTTTDSGTITSYPKTKKEVEKQVEVKVSNPPPLQGKKGGTGMFCKTHKAMRVGQQFTCGCIVG